MKKSQKFLTLILVLSLAAIVLLTACDLSGINEVLKTDIENCEVSFLQEEFEYTGLEIRPETVVRHFNKVLEYGTDYEAEYSDNIAIGTGHVTLSGIGNYKGQTVKDFYIVEQLSTRQPDGSSGDVSGNPIISSGEPNVPSGEISNGGEENTFVYTFSAAGTSLVSGRLVQSVEDVSQLVVPTVSKRGYDFLYWTYDGDEVDFDDIPSLPSRGATFVAEFLPTAYTVEYELYGGDNSPLNRDSYTVEDIFELQDAIFSGKQFAGWYIDGDFDERILSLQGHIGNLTLHAKFVNYEYRKLSYSTPSGVDEIPYEMIYPGTALTMPSESLSADGSQKLVWYIDEDMTVRHNLHTMPNEDVTLYARWEDKVYAGFLDRGWYKVSDIKSIDSYEDLLAYVEFIYYYNITQSNTKRITYISGEKNILAEFAKAINANTFPRMIGVSYNCYANNTGAIWMSSSVNGQATLQATEEQDFYAQIGDVFNNYQSNRESSFDDFAINNVGKTYQCSTSDQLFYVLSHGYRPLTVSGSAAYRIYNSFKSILREICDDRMSDLQKAKAIYDWLILNVYYDNNVAYTTLPQAGYKYDAFYLEGVLNGAAVCDGLSKAYSVMCAIEGIDCVRVTGSLKDASDGDAGHAWNKIQLMGKWYLSDTTWGNRILAVGSGNEQEYYEYVNGKYFLFTDYERAEVDNYVSDLYNCYVAEEDFNYYDSVKMQLSYTSTTIWGQTSSYTRVFDLYLDGDASQGMSIADEMSYVFEYVDKSGVSLEGMSFCVMFGDEMSTDIIREAQTIYINRVGRSNAKILSYNIVSDMSDIVDSANKVYREGSIITIILSLP